MITTRQALITIWTKPRATISQLCEAPASLPIFALVILGGILRVLDKAVVRSLGDTMSLPAILGVALVVGLIFSLPAYYLGSWAVAKSGKWLGGNGNTSRVRVAWAWSNAIPVTLSLLYIPELLILGEGLFTSAPIENPSLRYTIIGFGVVEFIGGIWALVVLLKALGEAQGFSAWKALGNLFVAGIVFVLPIIVTIAVIAIVAIRTASIPTA